MQDRLVWLLERFPLSARVIQAGPLARGAAYAASPGLGYLHVLEAGRIDVVDGSGGKRSLAQPSALLYLNPTAHRIVPRDAAVSMVCAAFEFGLGSGNPLARALPDGIITSLAEMPTLSSTLALLFAEAAEQHCGRQAILDRLMEVAVIHLLRDLMDQDLLAVGVLAGLADSKLVKALNALHAEPGGNWTVTTLAQAAGMSRARFAIRFRELVGMTPGEYLTDWRLGVAQSQLLAGHAITRIAADVGYSSAAALSRSFRSRFGIAPSAWLRQQRGATPNSG